MNNDRIKIEVLRKENSRLEKEVEQLTKQLNKPKIKVGIGVKK
jgi:hypothetical protein